MSGSEDRYGFYQLLETLDAAMDDAIRERAPDTAARLLGARRALSVAVTAVSADICEGRRAMLTLMTQVSQGDA